MPSLWSGGSSWISLLALGFHLAFVCIVTAIVDMSLPTTAIV